jgi:hypothetical protein
MDTFCADGVCCDKSCQAGCESCNLPNARGTCTNVPSGMDPKGVCPAGTAENAVCTPGGCSGAGGSACVHAAATVTCRMGSCSGGTAVAAATCQASGMCPPLTQSVCGVYTCGQTTCNLRCANDNDCVQGYYCTSGSQCQAVKGSGQACGAQHECQNGLTCVDGVCCNVPSCGSCRNCGSDGMCSVVVGSTGGTADTTGTTCSGAKACDANGNCLSVLGQACGAATACISGFCVDGVCCGVSGCGTCLNCGGTGACTVPVKNADDTSGSTCANEQSCDPNATCKTRWTLVGKVPMAMAPYPYYVAGAGGYIYFSSGNDETTPFAGVFKSFNISSDTFLDESRTNSPMCPCGYSGTLVAGVDNRVYMAANSADSYITGTPAWLTMGTAAMYTPRGEAATAVIGTHIYYAGGRNSLTDMQMFNTATGLWQSTGLAPLPNGTSTEDACAGAVGGVMYAFGGRARTQMMSYTESTNSWTVLPTSTTPPHGNNCNYLNLPVWRNNLVFADSQLEVFDPVAKTWQTPISLPSLANASWAVAVAGGGILYVVGWSAGTTYIYQWAFN